jgi:hypothetical protein
MTNESLNLINRISEMRNEDILRMVFIDANHYRPEAIVYAKAEIDRRGISLDDLNSISPSTPVFTDKPTAWGYKVMSTIRRNAFVFGYLTIIVLFVGANVYSYMEMPDEPRMADGIEECGFPFKVYRHGGFVGMHYILWDGLLADVMITTVAGILIGLVCKMIIGIRGKRPAV